MSATAEADTGQPLGETGTGVAPEELIGRVRALQERFEALPESPARSVADELVAAVVQMYGAGLERIVELVADAPEGLGVGGQFAADPLVSLLLLIHDLHPLPLEVRVDQALASVRPYMESHGGDVELLGLQDGVARIRLRGSCRDCSASAVTLELAIKQALEEHAPDLEDLIVEGVKANDTAITGAALPMVQVGLPAPAWHELGSEAQLGRGTMTRATVVGRELLIANVEDTLLAYADTCTGCGERLTAGRFDGTAVTCPGCATSFSLPRAGRALGGEELQLTPVPLLADGGSVRVALAT